MTMQWSYLNRIITEEERPYYEGLFKTNPFYISGKMPMGGHAFANLLAFSLSAEQPLQLEVDGDAYPSIRRKIEQARVGEYLEVSVRE